MSLLTSAWSVAIFAARETPDTLKATVVAAIQASAGRRATIDVLINGNNQLALAFADIARTMSPENSLLRVWFIAAPDKAHTWNEYAHRIWDSGGTAFFIDGYARVKPDALLAMQTQLDATPAALGATGVPTCGRSASKIRAQMLRGGGIHGNLYAVSAEGMHAIRQSGFRLPLGLYRTDPLLGAALMFRLDPANNTWDPSRITVVPSATWDVDGISQLSVKNLVSQFKRLLRQSQGELENRAAREHMAVKRLAPSALPRTVREMIHDWLRDQPGQARSLFLKRPLCLHAVRQLREPRDWSSTTAAPHLLLERAPDLAESRAG